jgi:hypothetical protein
LVCSGLEIFATVGASQEKYFRLKALGLKTTSSIADLVRGHRRSSTQSKRTSASPFFSFCCSICDQPFHAPLSLFIASLAQGLDYDCLLDYVRNQLPWHTIAAHAVVLSQELTNISVEVVTDFLPNKILVHFHFPSPLDWSLPCGIPCFVFHLL